jgi:hypothetical protein
MTISLTKEQFSERFERYHRLFQLAIKEDVKKISPLLYKVLRDETEIHIDISKPIGEFISKTIIRIIDLVYEENLD